MKNDMDKSITTYLQEISGNIFYHNLRIRFLPTEDIQINHWIGSIIRNNFLFAAEKTKTEEGKSLLNIIDTMPVEDKDPLFEEFSGGFPKGYTLTNVTSNNSITDNSVLHKNEIYTFSICLIGKMASYHSSFIEAVIKMCKRGIGAEKTELRLIDICELHPLHSPHLLYANGSDIINNLNLPININDFVNSAIANAHKIEINIHFQTPVNLIPAKEKKNREISYQNKLNGFPSFYQITRSAMYRLSKLSVFYGKICPGFPPEDNYSSLDEWLLQSTNLVLISANIQRETVYCIPQLSKENEIRFRGYTGHMSYYGSTMELLPFILFAQDLGIGSNVVYGLGEYKISYKTI